MKFFDTLIMVILVFITIFFRTGNLEGRMTFEWDQVRDLEAAETMVKTGTPVLLGPIVRGEAGGFYLGPLYYYLVTPLYTFSRGNPVALAVLSIGLDAFVVILLYYFLKTYLGKTTALLMAVIWACSPFIINNSQTPWNVSLIPIWTLLFIITLYKMHEKSTFKYLVILVFLASLTTNIHLSLVPIAAIFLAINYRKFIKLSLKKYVALGIAATLPISTIIYSDLTHSMQNTILLKNFLTGVSTKSASISNIIMLIVEKYGYTIGRLFTGEPYTMLGIIVTTTLIIYGFIYQKNNSLIRSSLVIILTIFVSLLAYRDSDFAEYYFTATFIPILILLGYFIKSITVRAPRSLRNISYGMICIGYLILGSNSRLAESTPYSLTVKKSIISTIHDLGYPIEFRTKLPDNRNTGFSYLLRYMGVPSDKSAARKVYVYEVQNPEIIAPEEARSVIFDYPIQAFRIVVFSN